MSVSGPNEKPFIDQAYKAVELKKQVDVAVTKVPVGQTSNKNFGVRAANQAYEAARTKLAGELASNGYSDPQVCAKRLIGAIQNNGYNEGNLPNTIGAVFAGRQPNGSGMPLQNSYQEFCQKTK